MKALLDDLLDYNQVSLGLGLALHRAPVDLAAACEEEVELLRAALPGHPIGYQVEGRAQGGFDGPKYALSISVEDGHLFRLGIGKRLVHCDLTRDRR
jgi:signal transduction histidine kinase